MAQARKTISITPQQEEWIAEQVRSGLFATDSDYIRDLIRKDIVQRKAERDLVAMLEEADNSGNSNRTVTNIIADAKQQLRQDGKL